MMGKWGPMGQSKILYTTPFEFRLGSAYKYTELLQRSFEGPTFSRNIRELPAALLGSKPDLMVVYGDRYQHWEVAARLRIPYLLIQNDVASMREEPTPALRHWEQAMVQNAQAVVFPSEDYRDYCKRRCKLPRNEVVHLRPLAKDLAFLPGLDGKLVGKNLVYAGGVMGRAQSGSYVGYRVMHDIFEAFIASGWKVHIYTSPMMVQHLDEYAEIGCDVHEPLHYPQLLREMGKYTAGFLGYPVNHATERSLWKAQTSRPNKTWDYLAAGIPTICMDAGAAESIVTSGGWGVACSMEDIPTIHEKLPAVDPSVRANEVMDQDLPRLEGLISDAFALPRPVSAPGWTAAPRVTYCTPFESMVGSRYKYCELLNSLVPGRIAVGRNSDMAQALIEHHPDFAVLYGDRYEHWEIATALGIPYMLIEHDVASMRENSSQLDISRERRMIENARAVLFPSEDYRDYCLERYKVPEHDVVHLRPLARDVGFVPTIERLEGRHLVYAGGVVGCRYTGSGIGYRVMHDIFKAFRNAGWAVHVYTATVHHEHLPEYSEIGCTVHDTLPYPELLREMGKYTAGLLGYPVDHATARSLWKAQTSRPNKAWDYLAAGIPTICLDAGAATEIVVDGGWGVECRMDEIPIVHEKLPIIDEQTRQREVMDQDLGKLERLLRFAMDGMV